MPNPIATGSGGQNAASLHSRLTAEQALTRLLELIRTSRYQSDFTPERLRQVMGTEINYAKDGADRYGFGDQITADWSYGFGVDKSSPNGRHFQFDFNPISPGASPDMGDICQLDFDKFSSELEAMGFAKTPYYVEHGRLMNYTFDRMRDGILEMRIDVYPEGEHVWNEQTGSGRACVKMIYIY